ncbi:DUF1456 family protein [Lacinutrix sp. 5H-3-7-4]|uniref:DUF1456 family protein n=1 Tax=Lacinutrix sp. (strain 5H-3-7-4) TaxID=983544 RepID=UPI00020A3A1A|nr:DUF1456 family protein [Lacinutrix sp. 5H-3-7-4]AEH00094.1 protein of unknown function DUF1456 [Lacinutrix sp. 5H-3-7-4]
MTNNDIFKKLRVAHKLRDDDIIKILMLVDFRVTKSELSAFFRREDHPNYVECGDQILRNFLNGLIIHLRGPMPKKEDKPKAVKTDNKKRFDNKKNFNKPRDKKKSND